MEGQQKSSICSLAYGSLAEAGATVDTHILTLCRPHYKPPSAILPVGNYILPSPESGTCLGSSRGVYDILFTPYSSSELLACTTGGTVLTFDINHAAFVSEIRVTGGPGAAPSQKSCAVCVHVNRDPNTPLLFSGSPNGDVMVFDSRIAGLSAKLLGGKFCPTLRLPSAHDGAICGIGTGVALHPQLFLTGGREDRWIRVFDLRFPFHYSSGDSTCGNPTPYPLEAKRLGPSEQEGGCQSLFTAFDVSPDGSLLAASVARHRAVQHVGSKGVLEGADGETMLISLPDGLRVIKTVASADGCAADFVQFSPNAKYVLQTGGVGAAHCTLCWQCACRCFCGPSLHRSFGASSRSGSDVQLRMPPHKRCEGDILAERRSHSDLDTEDAFHGGQLMPCQSPSGPRCAYHRAQLVNLVQTNRAVNLKSPADGAVAFTDSFCLSHSRKRLEQQPDVDIQLGPPSDAISVERCPPSLTPVAEQNCGFMRLLHFTLYGPQSGYNQNCRQRFWEYLSRVQSTRASSVRTEDVSTKVLDRSDSAAQEQATSRKERNQVSESSADNSVRSKPPTAAIPGTEAPLTATSEAGGATVSGARAPTKPLLFPLLHPQLSHFTSSCGPLHPAFVRAEAATWPFKCRLWGGLVVGYGGSTADRCGCHRLYDGLKLWDSTTGVVLSWAEGELACEDNLMCIAPLPDVSTSLLVTGGYVPSDLGKMRQSAPSAGLTFWSLRRRDDLLMSALEGSFSLDVQLNHSSVDGGGN
ncbi:hypothetical protein, conserved [Eimeria praecox]|uniref:Uncharacterized protein n=1 Tax=Eimeria praecox TaxID=51316 RepID=U6GSM1_9EIME|nr:hypothetical protein, conserved [Eimeria praecox]